MPVDLIPGPARKKALIFAVIADTVIFNLSLLFGYFLLIGYRGWFVYQCSFAESLQQNESMVNEYMKLWWLPFLIAPIGFYFGGLYRKDPYRLLVRSLERTFAASCTNVVMLLAVTYVFRASLTELGAHDEAGVSSEQLRNLVWGFSLTAMAVALVVGTLFVAGWRFLANRLENRLFKYTSRRLKLLVAGRLTEGDLLRLANNHSPCYELLGFVVGAYTKSGEDSPEKDSIVPCLGNTEDIEKIMERLEVEELIIVSEQLSRPEILKIVAASAERNINAWMVSDVYGTTVSALTHKMRAGVPFFEVRQTSISGWTLVVKRLIDIIASATMLLFTLPLFIIPACVAIVIDSKGFPVFSQYRVGKGGRIFRLFKLRTMVIDADRGPALTEDHDPRITAVGRFLRRTSIDELPQLWNVLKGDMSMVGPRAIIPYVADKFEDWERTSLDVKPGLTGLAQVSGRDEVGFREKSLLNIYYVRNYSLWLDLLIILATIRVVLSMEGTEGTRRDA